MEDLRESDRPIRVRWTVALFGAAVVLIAGHAHTVFYDGPGATVLRPIAFALVTAGILAGVLGLVVAAPLLQHPERPDSRRPIVLTVLCALGVIAAAVIMVLPFAAVLALIVVAATQLRHVERGAPSPAPSGRFRLALPYSLVVFALVLLGVLAAVGGPAAGWTMIVWAVTGSVAAVAVPVLWRRERTLLAGPPRQIVCAGLILVAVVGYGHWMTGLGEAPSGTGPSGTIIAMVGQLAAVATLLIGAPAWRRQPAETVPTDRG